MGFRLIPKNKALGLNANEAYTYFCLLAKSDYNTYISHVKLKNTFGTDRNKKNRIYIQAHKDLNI